MARTARDWIDLVLDPGWEERDTDVASADPLGFPGYASRDASHESVITADGAIAALPVVAISFDFEVYGGSMGVAAGEKIARAFERAIQRDAAVIAITATGGARMQEGMLALAQMAKTITARRALTVAGLPFLAYLRHPTTGGVYASFASLADVLWAEPGATIGFAGPRLAAQDAPLTKDSHTAEFSYANGLIDDIIKPEDLRAQLGVFLRATLEPDTPSEPRAAVEAPAGAATPWDHVQLARHPDRPRGWAMLSGLSDARVLVRGDRAGIDDEAILCGVARIAGRRCGILAMTGGKPTPAAYRKAYRLLRFAGALGVPLVTLIDTPGAEPWSASEAEGIARTIATAFRTVMEHPGPSVAVVTGEGGSGGALSLAVCDRLLICENAYFSVIAPESAASILKRDDVEAVATDLKLTPRDLVSFGLADGVVSEPPGGAHTDPDLAVKLVGEAIASALDELEPMPREARLSARRQRWRNAGNTFLVG